MWQGRNKKNRPGNFKVGIGRWRLVVAIVFLLSFSLIYRLFIVQVREGQVYKVKAANQHDVSSKLMPERGKIYFTETVNNQEKLYPVATNKELATLYTVPKDVANPRELAEKFYDFFDKPNLEAELSLQASGSVVAIIASSTKESYLASYLKRFDKPGDVYEPLNLKVDINRLLEFFSFLVSEDYLVDGQSASSSLRVLVPRKLTAADLEFKNEAVYYKTASSSKELKIPGLGFDLGQYRYYPEGSVGSQLMGYVSYSDDEGHGRYGLEEFFDTELFGKYGSLKSEKGAVANSIIVNDREYLKPESGVDLVLTIDRNIEFFACEKLQEAVKKHGATGGSVIVIEPKTGAIMAMCSEPNFDPNNYQAVKDISHFNNPALLYQYEPGSVFKVITMSAAIDQGKVTPATTYNDTGQTMITGWSKPISNSDYSTKGAHGVVDMNTVLDYSLNLGAIFAMRQIGPKTFADYVKNFGFGEKTGIELGSEGNGNIANLAKNKVREIDAATASFGQGIAVTPLQMVMSYQAIANHGALMQPYVIKRIIRNGQEELTSPKRLRQVISEKSAETISAMLVNIVEKGHAKKAAIPGYYVGGKTGTAQIATVGGYKQGEYIHTFIGMAPIENPTFVMLTRIDSPKDVQYAEGSAIPLFTEIADFILKYYQVPKTRT
jgi:cell division protein FtsI/penicillin-binding protein 2